MDERAVQCPSCKHTFGVSPVGPDVSVVCPKCKQAIAILQPHTAVAAAARDAQVSAPPPPSESKQPVQYPSAWMRPQELIPPDTFRYPYEKQALVIAIVAFVLLISFSSVPFFVVVPPALILTLLYLKVRQNSILGSCVAVNEKQFPEIHRLAVTAAHRLGMPVPPLFITQDPTLNAFALGFMSTPTVVLHSALVEALSQSENELLQVIGHEFAHVKCGHTGWSVLTGSCRAIYIPIISSVIGFIFTFWGRKAEYTCDRGGLLCCRSVTDAVRAMAKLAVGKDLYARMNLDEFLRQSNELGASQFSGVAECFATHPYILNRIRELVSFSESNAYAELTQRLP